MKILIAEDEPKVRSFVKKATEEAGFTVDAVDTVEDLLASVRANAYDILILDRLLKGRDSLDRIADIRRSNAHVKILVLSALSEVEDKVKGLTEGADDYLGKPFHVGELIARLRSLARRTESEGRAVKDTLLAYEDVKIDLETQRVFRANKRVDLSAKEFRLLCTLARHPGKVFSKMELLDQVWDMNHFPESNVVEVTIAGLRGKIDKGFRPLIHNRRGVGYWLGEA
ncbi:MAG TPA: response regulator transcription factor [bacterium]|nr:response regulator transcription factor [bacterium]